MSVLTITYSDHTNFVDYDGLTVSTRTYSATIDGKATGMRVACATTAIDADMRQKMRDVLLSKGWAWTSEAP